MNKPKVTDTGIEHMVSTLLRTGVLISGLVVLTGGVYFGIRHAGETADFHNFKGEPGIDRIVHRIVLGAVDLRARSIIQLGILLLIATPILRVAFSLVGFALERDKVYVLITSIVLAVLLYSLIGGAVAG
jgi:uncharacterized membrane protein